MIITTKNSKCRFSNIQNENLYQIKLHNQIRKKSSFQILLSIILCSNSLISLFLSSVLLSGCNSEPNKLKLIFTGDLMLDRGTRAEIELKNPDYLFIDIKYLFLSSDATIANFECVACEKSLSPTKKKFTFRANPEWLKSIRNNGITYLTVSNNHSYDFGEEGLKQTISNISENNIFALGYKSDSASKCLPGLIEKNKNKIAIFSTTFLKEESPSICNENVYELIDKIKEFKITHPLYLIFICIHWGVEMELKPTIEQIQQAHLLIDEGADVIIGHHPHTVQTIEKYKGKHIFYSLGNFIFDNDREPANRGILANFSVSDNKIEQVKIIPFNIFNSKAYLMQPSDSKIFMKDIMAVSRGITLKLADANWTIL